MLLGLQVLLRRGLPRLLPLGDLLVFVVGEVLGFPDVADLLLRLGLLPPRRRILLLLWGIVDGEGHTLGARQHPEVVDEDAGGAC